MTVDLVYCSVGVVAGSSNKYCWIKFDNKDLDDAILGEDEFEVERDGVLPMWGWMWSFGDSADDYWLEELDGFRLISQCGFRIYEHDEWGYFFGIDGAGYSFMEEHEFKNFTGSTGFRIRKPDGTAGYAKARTAYLNAIDLAHAESVNGLFSPQEAIRNAIRTLTDSGIRFVEYESGRIFHADVAVRRAVMTGISQITGNISKYNAEKLGTDIVEVTAHAGARPDHAEWQGKLYSLSGLSDKYPSLVAVTGYGTGEGLKGWNCRHDFHPYIEGVSERSYTDEELENIDPPPINYDGRIYTYYECTQRQRHMETAMRRTKRELIGAKATDDQEYFTEKAIRLRRQKEEYERFSKYAGLLTEYERTHVYELNHSVAGKLSAVYRKNPQ